MDHLCHTPQVCIGFLHLFPSSFCPGCCHRHLTLHIARIAAAARGIGKPQRIGRMPLASPRSGLGRIWSGRSLALALLSLSRVDASSLPSSSRPSLPLPPPFHCFARRSAPTPSGLESTTRLLFSFPQWHERSSAAHATRAAFSSWPIPPVPISCLLL